MRRCKISFLSAMGIFGTVGLFVRLIPLPSATIAFSRGLLGVLFLIAVMLFRQKKPHWAAIRKNLLWLCLSGVAIGINWISLFESYRYTTVATATVCYYLAPIFLLLAAPLVGEKLTLKKLLCIATALAGLVCVSGIPQSGLPSFSELRGIVFGLGAAVFYATVMVINKRLSPIPAYDKTIVQLSVSTVILVPYLFFSGGFSLPAMGPVPWLALLVVGIVHTGFAYTLYFGSFEALPAKTIAVFSYVDPAVAVVLSALLLWEIPSSWDVAGTVLILGSTLYSELS